MAYNEASGNKVREKLETGLGLAFLNLKHTLWILRDVILEGNNNWGNVLETKTSLCVTVGTSADIKKLGIELPHLFRNSSSSNLSSCFWFFISMI